MYTLHRLVVFIAVAMVALAAQGQPMRADAGVSVRLLVKDAPRIAADTVWRSNTAHHGIIEIDIDSDFAGVVPDGNSKPLLLEVRTAAPSSHAVVRQRSATYLNVGDEGPHLAVPGAERRGEWKQLTELPGGRFVVQRAKKQFIQIGHHRIVDSKEGDRWNTLLAQCKSADSEACYTVTDLEFELTFKSLHGRAVRKIIRVAFPNGC